MTARRSSREASRRRGFGLVELAISGLMLAVAMAATVRVVGWVADERRSVARRERAVAEAANLMERIASRPFDEITAEALAGLRLPGAALASLPNSNLRATVEGTEGTPPGKRITVEIRWIGRSGRAESPVRLVSWCYRKGGPPR